MAISDRTIAIIIGASRFPKAPSLASGSAFSSSASAFYEYLLDPLKGPGLLAIHVLNLFDDTRAPSDLLEHIADFICHTRKEFEDSNASLQDLLIYYVGHGGFARGNQDYFLAVKSTNEKSAGVSSIRIVDLASVIKEYATFVRRYLILDCCFAASAFREFQSGPAETAKVKILTELPKRGTAILCSSSANDASLAPEGLGRTMFSDALLEALLEGEGSLGPQISFSELGALVKDRLRTKYPEGWVRPQVLSPEQQEGDIADLPMFPNPAFGLSIEGPQSLSQRGAQGRVRQEHTDTIGKLDRNDDPTDRSFLKRITTWQKIVLTVAASALVVLTAFGVMRVLNTSKKVNRIPSPTSKASTSTTPKAFTSITVGASHSCGLTSDGATYCWGQPSLLGNGGEHTGPDRVLGSQLFKNISAGSSHTCGITIGDQAYCWGFDAIGDGSSGGRDLPVRVLGLLHFQSVSAGESYNCGVTIDSRAYCWGNNENGQLGNGSENFANAPVPVSGNLQFRSVSAGQDHTCGLTNSGVAYCWGDDNYDALGRNDARKSNPLIPAKVSTSHTFTDISASTEWGTCGLTSTGEVYCWGAPEGRLDGAVRATPIRLKSDVRFKAISAGVSHKCGVSIVGDGYCWGENKWGELGDGTQKASATPVRVQGNLQFAAIVTGRSGPFTCGLTLGGTVYCWGMTSEGHAGKNYPYRTAVLLPTEIQY